MAHSQGKCNHEMMINHLKSGRLMRVINLMTYSVHVIGLTTCFFVPKWQSYLDLVTMYVPMSIRMNTYSGHAGCKLGRTTTIATTLSHCFPFPHQGEGRTNRGEAQQFQSAAVAAAAEQGSANASARPHNPPGPAAVTNAHPPSLPRRGCCSRRAFSPPPFQGATRCINFK